MFSDPDLVEFASSKRTIFPEYQDQTMFIDNCPKEVHIQYPFIWDWYSDLDYSKDIKINLRKMKFLQAFVYKIFRIDADRCFNEKHKPKKKTDDSNG